MTGHMTRSIIIAALAGTSLSGCAFLGSAKDTVWSGTKAFANFMVTPVGELLRPAPQDDIQFAAAETEDSVETAEIIEKTEHNETKVAEAVETADDDAVWRKLEIEGESHADMTFSELPVASMSETVVTVTDAPMAATTRTVSYDGNLRTETVTKSFETVSIDQSRSLQVKQGDEAAYIHMEGAAASLQDWRACEESAGGYWTFDGADNAGRMNPAFQQCMSAQDYQMKTTVKTETIPASQPVTVTTVSTLP